MSLSQPFTPLEMLIICDLVNDIEYMNSLLRWREGHGRVGPDPGTNEPSKTTTLNPNLPLADDTDDWHKYGAVGWWTQNKRVNTPSDIEAFEQSINDYPGADPNWDSVEPPNDVILDFLMKLEKGPNPWPAKRNKLCLLCERFAGVFHVATGRRIVQSLTMFVDFTVRKDNGKSRLAW